MKYSANARRLKIDIAGPRSGSRIPASGLALGLALLSLSPTWAQDGEAPPAPVARAAQALAPDSLQARLRDEFKAIGPATFVMGTTEEETLGRAAGNKLDITGQPFRIARGFAVAERPAHPANVNFSLRNTLPLQKGDHILVTYYARGKKRPDKVDDGLGALVQPILKGEGVPYGHLSNYHNITELGQDWDRYWFRSSALPRDYAPGEVEMLFMVGNKAQDVEIGGLAVMAFAQGADTTKFPRRTWTYPGREANAPWRKEADARIEKHRKGDLSVRVVDGRGRPIRNAQVRIEQKSHAFRFGTAVTGPAFFGRGKTSQADSERYREILARYFNACGAGERHQVEADGRRQTDLPARADTRDARMAQGARVSPCAATSWCGRAGTTRPTACSLCASASSGRRRSQEELRTAIRSHITQTSRNTKTSLKTGT
jgi:hypothetical protein